MDNTPAPVLVDNHPTQDVHKLGEDDERDRRVLAKLAELQVGDWHQGPSTRKLLDVLEAVLKSDPKLDEKWLNGDRVSQIPKEVWTAVENGWRTGSFKRLCTLILLCNLQNPESGKRCTIDPDQVALMEAMTDAYRGAYVDKFARYLRESLSLFNEPGGTYYAKFCAITQSPGTGKTRLLLELGKELTVLYINLQSTEDMAYPPWDIIPARILTDTTWYSKESYERHCRIFFATVFKCLADFFLQNPDHLGVLSCIGHKTREEFFKNFGAEFEELEKESNAREVMYEHCKQLQDCLKGRDGRNTDKTVVIALDEAHVLREKIVDYIPADVLLRTIKEYSEKHKDGSVWVVFASTAPNIAYPASSQSLFPSPRAVVGEQLVFRPFTALGWDQHAPALNEVELDKVSWGSHLLRYGRPLWWSLKKSGYSVRHIIDFAKQKLCGSPTFKPIDDHQVFAVLGQRFGLDIAFGHRHAVQYNDTLVADHLRFCIMTTEDGMWSYTAYPSEPIVSVAAAKLLHMGKYSLNGTLKKLLNMVNDGLINFGDAGGLAGRLLWLLAKDFCVRTGLEKQISSIKMDDWNDEDISYCRPVPVVEFLKLTFGPEILKAAPDAQEIFEDAFINFSHWIQMESDITQGQGVENEVPIDEWTASLWARTCAVQCHPDQPVVDKVIPIYFKSRPRQEAFSHILISDTARERLQKCLTDKITRQHEHITPGYQGPPYIVILVDLGLSDSAINVCDETGTSDPCLRINAAALGTKTFPFLEEGIASSLRDLYDRHFMDSSHAYLEKVDKEAQFGAFREASYMKLAQTELVEKEEEHNGVDNNKGERGEEEEEVRVGQVEQVPRKTTKICRFAKTLRKVMAVGRKKVG